MILARGNTTLDTVSRALSADTAVRLSRSQVTVLELLIRRPGLVRRSAILDALWGTRPDGPEEKILDVYVYFLRRALRAVGSDITIVTERGHGYSIEGGDIAAPALLVPSWLVPELVALARRHRPDLLPALGELA